MRISDFQPDGARVRESQLSPVERAPAKREEGRRESATDRVNLSPFSETLMEKLDSTSKVEALRAAYESGVYRVDPESLAKDLIKAHLNQPGPTRTDSKD